MASSADEVFAACGLPVLVDQHGQAAVYVANDGTETAIVLLENKSAADEIDAQQGGKDKRRTKRVGIQKSEVATVALNDTVTFEGLTWSIREIEGEDGSLTRVRLARREAEEITRPGYRRR